MPSSLPTVSVVALGGTIASVPDDTGRGVTPQLSPEDLFASVRGASDVADVRLVPFRQLPSGDLGFDDLAALALVLRDEAARSDGVVVTQGTDTLEETSYLLDLLYDGATPVVVTGAMRNPALPGTDGPANLLAALRVAVSEDARDLGPLVVFAEEIHLPRFVRKVHTSSVTAFASPACGPVGWVSEDRVRIPLVPRRRTQHLDPDALAGPMPSVGVVQLGLGSGALPPEQVAGLQGLVVAAFGGGHVPGRTVESLAEIARRIPVVVASRTGAGELYRGTYGFPGSERDLLERGLVSAGVLDAAKARILLAALLASGAGGDRIRAAFRIASE